MGLVLWCDNGTKSSENYTNLSEHILLASPARLGEAQLYTNTKQIVVSLAGDETSDKSTFYLYDAQDDAGYIQVLSLDLDNQTKMFSNLTAETTYYIVAGDIDSSAMIRISAD